MGERKINQLVFEPRQGICILKRARRIDFPSVTNRFEWTNESYVTYDNTPHMAAYPAHLGSRRNERNRTNIALSHLVSPPLKYSTWSWVLTRSISASYSTWLNFFGTYSLFPWKTIQLPAHLVEPRWKLSYPQSRLRPAMGIQYYKFGINTSTSACNIQFLRNPRWLPRTFRTIPWIECAVAVSPTQFRRTCEQYSHWSNVTRWSPFATRTSQSEQKGENPQRVKNKTENR